MGAIFNNRAHHNGVAVLLDAAAAGESPPSPRVVRLLNIPHLSFTPLIGKAPLKRPDAALKLLVAWLIELGLASMLRSGLADMAGWCRILRWFSVFIRSKTGA